MRNKKTIFIIFLLFFMFFSIQAQTHLAVPLGNPVYHVIEQAQIRGLIGYLPAVKPYSYAQILLIIEEILDNTEELRFGGLTEAERSVLEHFLETFTHERDGLDLLRGTISGESESRGTYFSWEFGFGFEAEFAGSVFPVAGGYRYNEGVDHPLFAGANHPVEGDAFFSFDTAIMAHFKGDLGRNASYGFGLNFRMLRTPRTVLGQTENYYGRYAEHTDGNLRPIIIYSEPLSYFPFTHKKSWDAHLFAPGGLTASGQLSWPEGFSLGYNMIPEFAASFLNDHVYFRASRHDREWAGVTGNSSLVLNQSAQPFLGMELVIQPLNWLTISSMTGVLEFEQSNISEIGNGAELKESAAVFQNAFSIVMLELSYKNYFKLDIGSSAVWPKRFELGYLFPFADNFVYQNSIGDFDNLTLFFNIQGQYPGLGRLWFSFFLDEGNPFSSGWFTIDRNMTAFQIGAQVHIPRLSFSSITVSYTKIEPFTYTHTRISTPWHQSDVMETQYTNFGRSLGHYIPPNSDEFLIRFDTMPVPESMLSLQYQLIRSGAGYGNRTPDGTSLWSELSPDGRTRYTKHFLRDGAYQWMHILRVRGGYSFAGMNMPVRAFAELGGVYSYFTDIDASIDPAANPGRHSYRIVNNPMYPHTLSFIGVIGIQIFPKW